MGAYPGYLMAAGWLTTIQSPSHALGNQTVVSGLTDAISGSFPTLTPRQIAEGGYTPSAAASANIPTRPNTPIAHQAVDTPTVENQVNADPGDQNNEVRQDHAAGNQETTASGKKRRRTDTGPGNQQRDGEAMDEDSPDTPTKPARPVRKAAGRGMKTAQATAAQKRAAAATPPSRANTAPSDGTIPATPAPPAATDATPTAALPTAVLAQVPPPALVYPVTQNPSAQRPIRSQDTMQLTDLTHHTELPAVPSMPPTQAPAPLAPVIQVAPVLAPMPVSALVTHTTSAPVPSTAVSMHAPSVAAPVAMPQAATPAGPVTAPMPVHLAADIVATTAAPAAMPDLAPPAPMPTPTAAAPVIFMGLPPPAAPIVAMAPPLPAIPIAAPVAAPAANTHAIPAHVGAMNTGAHAPHLAINATAPTIAIMPATANMPQLQGISADEILKNHHPTQRAQWVAFPGPKGLILPFDPGYTIPGAAARVPLLQRAVKHILNLPDNPKIGCPTHDADTFSQFAPPHFYLLAGLSVAQLNTLATTQVWSTDIISFFVLPFTPQLTTYVASFTGLSVPGSAEHIDGIENAFRAEILGNPRILALVANFHDNINTYSTPLDALTSLTNALSITAWESPQGTIWNLYISSPTCVRAAYEEWVIMMEALRVFSVFEGSAVRTTIRHCTRCLSHDHITNNCPFPLLPGWLGAGPLISRPKPARGRGSQRSRPSRGRGYNNRGM